MEGDSIASIGRRYRCKLSESGRESQSVLKTLSSVGSGFPKDGKPPPSLPPFLGLELAGRDTCLRLAASPCANLVFASGKVGKLGRILRLKQRNSSKDFMLESSRIRQPRINDGCRFRVPLISLRFWQNSTMDELDSSPGIEEPGSSRRTKDRVFWLSSVPQHRTAVPHCPRLYSLSSN